MEKIGAIVKLVNERTRAVENVLELQAIEKEIEVPCESVEVASVCMRWECSGVV
jgi:hypothetical protein